MSNNKWFERLCVGVCYVILLIIMYIPVVFSNKTLQSALYYPHGVTESWPYGYHGRKTANTFDIDLATPAYYEYPMNRYIGTMYRHGRLPLWDPYQGCGTPLIGQYSSRLFFPYQILEDVCPAWSWDFFLLGRLWIAGFFTYLFLRFISISMVGAFLGGVFYMLSGTMTWFINLEQMTNVAMMLPILMYCVERFVVNRSGRNMAFLSLAFAFVLLAGQPEVALYVIFLGAGYFFFRLFFMTNLSPPVIDVGNNRDSLINSFKFPQPPSIKGESIVTTCRLKAILVRSIYSIDYNLIIRYIVSRWKCVRGYVLRFILAFILGLMISAPLLLPFIQHFKYSYNIHPPGGTMGVENPPPLYWALSLVIPSFFEIPADADYANIPFSRLVDNSGKTFYYRVSPINGRWDFLGGYCGVLPIYLTLTGLAVVFLRRGVNRNEFVQYQANNHPYIPSFARRGEGEIRSKISHTPPSQRRENGGIQSNSILLNMGQLQKIFLFFTCFGFFIILKNFGIPPFKWLGYLPLFDQAWSQRWAGPAWTYCLAVSGAMGWEIVRDGLKEQQLIHTLSSVIRKLKKVLWDYFSISQWQKDLFDLLGKIKCSVYQPGVYLKKIPFIIFDIAIVIICYRFSWLLREQHTLIFSGPLMAETTFNALPHYYVMWATSVVAFSLFFGLYDIKHISFTRLILFVPIAVTLQILFMTGYYFSRIGFIRYPASIFLLVLAFSMFLILVYRMLVKMIWIWISQRGIFSVYNTIHVSGRQVLEEMKQLFHRIKERYRIIILLSVFCIILVHIRYLILFFQKLAPQQKPYFWPSLIIGQLIAFAMIAIAFLITRFYINNKRGMFGLIALGVFELWYAIPRGYSYQWMYLEVVLLLVGFFVAWACTVERWRVALLGTCIFLLSFFVIDIKAPYGFPERYDPFGEVPYVNYLKKNMGNYRAASGYGVLIPNFASAMEIPSVHYIQSLAVAWYHRYRMDNLHIDTWWEEGSDILWFSGTPEFHVNKNGKGIFFYRGFEEDFKAKLPFYSLLGVKYFLAPTTINIHKEELNQMENHIFSSPCEGGDEGVIEKSQDPLNIDLSQKIQPLEEDYDFLQFPLVYDKEIKIYQNLRVLPRAFMVYQFDFTASYADAQEMIRQPGFDLRNRIVLEEPVPDNYRGQSLESKEDNAYAEILSYEPNKVIIETKTDKPGMLVLSDIYYPDWKVKVDDEPAHIYRVDGLIRGVFVNQGVHKVVFYYQPMSFFAGVALAGISLILCLYMGISSTDAERSFKMEVEPLR